MRRAFPGHEMPGTCLSRDVCAAADCKGAGRRAHNSVTAQFSVDKGLRPKAEHRRSTTRSTACWRRTASMPFVPPNPSAAPRLAAVGGPPDAHCVDAAELRDRDFAL